MIFNIQRFSTHDGQGIRTMVFFKGCPLRCRWCSNPESQSFLPVLMYDAKKCKNFRDCLKTGDVFIDPAPYGITIKNSIVSQDKVQNELFEYSRTSSSADNDVSGSVINKQPSVSGMHKYNSICASRALTVAGEEKSIEEIIEIIKKDALFYGKEGGVTLSGGEPLSGGDAFTGLLAALKENQFNVAVETSLHVAWEKITGCIKVIDTLLADLKHTDAFKFERFTGGNAELVLDNLRKLRDFGNNLIIRIPVIPGFNHTLPEMEKIIDFVYSLGYVREIHFLPFHNMGSEKYRMMGMDNPFEGRENVNASELDGYVEYATKRGVVVRIGG